jgi:hypothetical protein
LIAVCQPHHALVAVLGHRPLVVDHVVQVGRARIAVHAGARHPQAGAGLAVHLGTQRGGIGQARRHHVARAYFDPTDFHLLRAVQPQLVQRLEHVDELRAEAVLEGGAFAFDPAWHQQHFFVLDVDTLDGSDAVGKVENLWLREWFGGEPTAVGLPDHRRVQALLDGGPDRERRRELVAVDRQVRPVARAQLVDVGEQVIGGVAGEHVGKPGLHADPDQREAPGGAPLVLDGELLVAELDAGEFVWLLGMPQRQAHGHVEVVGATGQRAVEDRHHEPRVDGVHDVGDVVAANEFGDVVGRRRVDLRGGESRVAHRVGGLPCSALVVVTDHDLFEELSAHGDGAERRSDTTGAH